MLNDLEKFKTKLTERIINAQRQIQRELTVQPLERIVELQQRHQAFGNLQNMVNDIFKEMTDPNRKQNPMELRK